MSRRSTSVDPAVIALTQHLADVQAWNWKRMACERIAANAVLRKMAELGMIKHRNHPMGGDIWIVDGQVFGRTDSLPKSYSRYKDATR